MTLRDQQGRGQPLLLANARLKKAKVDSVLIDLRGNGGGSLSEAIQLTGLFIGSGPVVQQCLTPQNTTRVTRPKEVPPPRTTSTDRKSVV